MSVRYTKPGMYVAICNKTNFDGHYTKVFEFPAVGKKAADQVYQRMEGHAAVDATWWFLNAVDLMACVDAVYPIEIFNKLR